MPPIVMIFAVLIVAALVFFGPSSARKYQEEVDKYGRDPLVRQIKKFNEKDGGMMSSVTSGPYAPPPGARLYQIPTSSSSENVPWEKDKPAPEIPMTDWGKASAYPPTAVAPMSKRDVDEAIKDVPPALP